MKKFFIIAVGIIMASVLLLVGYGAYLNYRSEKVIATRMENRVISLEGSKAERRSIMPVWNLGSVNLTAENVSDVVSRQEGIIDELFVRKDDKVKKGDPICRIINEEIPIRIAQIDVNIAKAKAVSLKYKHSYERYDRLIKIGAVSQEQYEEVYTNYKASLEELKQLELEKSQYLLQANRLILEAPFDGEVLLLYKKLGTYLQPGEAVALIGNFKNMQFVQTVTDDELLRLGRLDIPGELVFSKRDLEKIYDTGFNVGNKGEGERFTARIVEVVPPPEAPAVIRKVYWSVDNSSGLLEPRRYHDVQLSAIRERTGLTIPKKALLDDSNNTVYVWDESSKRIKIRNVSSGPTDGNYVEIFDGLREGEIVIVSGKEGLNDGQKANVKMIGGDISAE